MEHDMAVMAIKALGVLMDPTRMAFLAFGVLLGLVIGVIPGLGGLVGLALILPFTFDMDPYTALAFMLGLQSVTATSDTIPAVLFGVPGTVASAATIMDGYPMAKRGEAGRALGAGFAASVLGGLFGAFLLGVSVPMLRPVMLYIGSPELLSFCVFGISLVAVLSGTSVLKGMAAAAIGILIATTGDDPQTGTLRWTFNSLYLWDGVPIVPVALGLFALPELADLAIANKAIFEGDRQSAMKGQFTGIKDVFRHWFLVVRCSAIGAGLGAVPGIGASVIDWIAYGHAARTEKNARLTFTTGDVRGVIASESSNNAKEGGALVPTIAFGVPGSASMALILGAFLIHGIVPGPDMLNKHLDVTYTLVWSVAIANILGAGICFLLADQFAKLALVRAGILVPAVLAVVFVGAFQGSRSWGDLYALILFGVLGWIMKYLKWPRPPLVLGFVLGGLIERYMFISVERYGWTWMLHPIVVVVFVITVYGLASPVARQWWEAHKAGAGQRKKVWRIAFRRDRLNREMAFAAFVLGVFLAAVGVSSQWEFGAKLIPQVIGWGGALFVVLYMMSSLFLRSAASTGPSVTALHGPLEDLRGRRPAPSPAEEAEKEGMHYDIGQDFGTMSKASVVIGALTYLAWCLGFLGTAALIGLLPAILVFLIAYMRFHACESWATTLGISVPIAIGCYLLFHLVLVVPWPQSVVGDMFPVLRTTYYLNLF